MTIKNYDELASTRLRKVLLGIANAGFDAIDTEGAINRMVELEKGILKVKDTEISLDKVKRIFIVGVGKCAFASCKVLSEKLGEKVTGGIAIDIDKNIPSGRIKYIQGDHPFPSKRNVDATRKLLEFLDEAEEDDLVIALISGGGSTLLCQPKNFTCEKEVEILQALFKEGADIEEINTIRKHISDARGGGIAKHAYPARIVSLIFSDVVGDNLEFISSGPTVRDTTTIEDAEAVLDKYRIKQKFGFGKEKLVETPKDDRYFKNVKNILFISNKDALDAMQKYALNSGFNVVIKDREIEGEARIIGLDILNKIEGALKNTVHLYGGETTVTIEGNGEGGRNQELVLSALRNIKDGFIISSFASDGYDNTPNAGALCDIITKNRSQELDLNIEKYLSDNDSYNFFEKSGDAIVTGKTGSNVSDLIIAIKE